MGMIVDRSLTAARWIGQDAKTAWQAALWLSGTWTEPSDWMDFIAMVVYYDEPFLKIEPFGFSDLLIWYLFS